MDADMQSDPIYQIYVQSNLEMFKVDDPLYVYVQREWA